MNFSSENERQIKLLGHFYIPLGVTNQNNGFSGYYLLIHFLISSSNQIEK